MDQLSKVACYFRWTRCPKDPPPSPLQQNSDLNQKEGFTLSSVINRLSATTNLDDDSSTSVSAYQVLESIVFWENSARTIAALVVFNLLFWAINELQVHGITTACSAALVLIFLYRYLEFRIQRDKSSPSFRTPDRLGQIENIESRLASIGANLRQLRQEQPGVFCLAVCFVSFALWIIGRNVNGVLIAYAVCMSFFLGPLILLKLPDRIVGSHKEWDNEIDEFLPAVTEDNLQVLRRAGDSGDQSSTPTSVTSEAQNEFFDDDLMGLKMPSHDDGSADDDDAELSDLELSTGDTDVDGIKFQSGHFEKGSSSEEEAELRPEAKKLMSLNHESDDSYSDFEIIDSQEVENHSYGI